MYACLWCLEVFRPVGHTPFAQTCKNPYIHLHFTCPLQPCFGGTNTMWRSLYKDYVGLNCHVSGIVEGGVIPDPWSLPRSLKWTFSPHSSLKNKHPGPLLTAQGWETCLIICACRPCPHSGSNGLLLGRTALLTNHGSGKWVVCSGRFAMTKPLWKRLSVSEKKESSLLSMSTTEGPGQGVI